MPPTLPHWSSKSCFRVSARVRLQCASRSYLVRSPTRDNRRALRSFSNSTQTRNAFIVREHHDMKPPHRSLTSRPHATSSASPRTFAALRCICSRRLTRRHHARTTFTSCARRHVELPLLQPVRHHPASEMLIVERRLNLLFSSLVADYWELQFSNW
jgi:hypothetical protein